MDLMGLICFDQTLMSLTKGFWVVIIKIRGNKETGIPVRQYLQNLWKISITVSPVWFISLCCSPTDGEAKHERAMLEHHFPNNFTAFDPSRSFLTFHLSVTLA